MQIRTTFLFIVGGLFALLAQPALANHCQIHGRVLRGTSGGKGLEGIAILKTPIENLGMDTVYTDASGAFEFTHLPGWQTYTVQISLPAGFSSIDAVNGVNTQLGDSGQVSISTRVNTSTLTVWVAGGCISSENLFMISSPADLASYRSFTASDLIPSFGAKLLRPVRRGKGMPNASNLVWETVAFGGFAPGSSQSDVAGGLRIGIPSMIETAPDRWKPDPVFGKEYAWVRLTKWDFKSGMGKNFVDVQTTLFDRTGTHTGAPRGFDWLFSRGVPHTLMLGEKHKLVPRQQNNKLFADLVALKINIAASEQEQTPYGFGDLIYYDTNALSGLSVRDIALRADSAMTFWVTKKWDYNLLDDVISKINTSFRGSFTPADTISFVSTDKLVMTGTAPVYTVPFMYSQAGPVNTKRTPPAARPHIPVGEPGEFSLGQNYPNPFNPTTTIDFELAAPAVVTLKVFNVLGQEVATLIDGERMESGSQEASFDAGRLSSGVYLYRLWAQDPATGDVQFKSLRKMVLLK
jgi:hypothetical protein